MMLPAASSMAGGLKRRRMSAAHASRSVEEVDAWHTDGCPAWPAVASGAIEGPSNASEDGPRANAASAAAAAAILPWQDPPGVAPGRASCCMLVQASVICDRASSTRSDLGCRRQTSVRSAMRCGHPLTLQRKRTTVLLHAICRPCVPHRRCVASPGQAPLCALLQYLSAPSSPWPRVAAPCPPCLQTPKCVEAA